MKDKTGSIHILSRRSFLQLALGTAAAMAFDPATAFAALPVGKYLDNVKFVVLSDTHYYDPSLGTTGPAFEAYLAQDRKMLAESKTTLESVINAIKKSDAQFVIVCGDLTKDGEYLCHQKFADYMRELAQAGKPVYVINGNHDIDCPNAYSYSGSTKTRVPNTSGSEFKRIYNECGYNKAIAVDPNSLSYVVEPAKGLRLVAMDSCVYGATRGSFTTDRLNWIKNQIKASVAEGKTVIGMMHHGIVPHFSAQPQFWGEYVVENYDQVAKELSSLGMKIVFTGHFHAQDIAEKQITGANGDFLIDVETGSLVTYPIPYRYVEFSPDRKKLRTISQRVTTTAYNTGNVDFQTYAKNFTANNMKDLLIQYLAILLRGSYPTYTDAQLTAMATGYAATKITPSLTVSDIFIAAMIAHYQGDENPDSQTRSIYQSLASSSDATVRMMGQYLVSIGTESLLADNNNVIDLVTGKSLQTF
ncbi:MAG TPA: metallophosphoesterase [Methylomusa anaerophila]|uniref:Cyclic 3',5'-adenosine monophosphate phosphodiesterase n=1 Tax=Methylomusa anaerophila TaxID=1930071 RepID=A0A348AM47_9FIRM|nr:metallophosphoesterase [Methylomusa anaerophila]BBB92145.1 cyclic 3',5'-adenosine monophosphate phosphodiesterase [Methylomusa anaerophila]HML87841.1 metallophosphoesterase [Methylomusa anaerophila]